ncbi:MAG: hypothetical protein HY319_04765 [Armatimonadetes bacterium]|nr:hypothetical protein [Armatimonadota bacterium]
MEMSAERRPYLLEEGAIASVPHAPGEFREILDVDPLEGLDGSDAEFPVPPPPLDEEYFPCSGCHDPEMDNPKRRELEEHLDIQLNHGDKSRWCLDCHDFQDRDSLKLAGGQKIPFTESYRLCGQCHGTQYRDWRVGIHGKRTGYWNGPKRYLLCAHCHWPHEPRFKSLKPLPPPVRPEYLDPRAVRPNEKGVHEAVDSAPEHDTGGEVE